MIIGGSTAQALAAALADELDEPLVPVSLDRFPDGELLASVPDFEGERAIVVASTITSDGHLEVLQLQDAAREAGAEEVVTVLGYMGYGQQDEAFARGEPVSARAMARAISSGTDRVVTVTPHEPDIAEHFEPMATVVEGAPALADALPETLDDPAFVAPDAGAKALSSAVRDAYGAGDVDYFEKIRHSPTDVEITPSDVAVTGRDVVLVDDIVATGGTMSEAVTTLREREVGRVFVTCVHPLLVGGAYTRLMRAGVAGIYGTDTIEGAATAVSVAPIVAEALERGD